MTLAPHVTQDLTSLDSRAIPKRMICLSPSEERERRRRACTALPCQQPTEEEEALHQLHHAARVQESKVIFREFQETCHSVTFHFMKKDSKRCCNTTMPESIHTKDESKRGTAFAFIFGVN